MEERYALVTDNLTKEDASLRMHIGQVGKVIQHYKKLLKKSMKRKYNYGK